jgi:bifunctional ADP-heptose synthase (sugar kinase/adenylyltransferase)|tara:strand:- start:761 stop:1645 length:885 start_codon:yes stop_codon:yes gene_type:complete
MLDRKKVLVIGDLITDEYIETEAVGLSLESPTIKTKFISKRKQLGGAGNLVMNLRALEREVCFITAFNDLAITNILEDNNIQYFNLHKQNNVKSRYYINRKGNNYKHLQVNHDKKIYISKDEESVVLTKIIEIIDQYESVILSDYRTGLLTKNLILSITKLCSSKKIPCIVNTQISDWGNKKKLDLQKFKHCSLFVLNEEENKFFNLKTDKIVTKGSKGCWYKGIVYPPRKAKVIDTCGAGDSFTAMASVMKLNNSLKTLDFCNIWASLATETEGATPPSYEVFKSIISERYKS